MDHFVCLTPLFHAIYRADLERVRALLAAGADVAQAHPRYGTPLMIASQLGQTECVRALLDAGADVAQADTDGSTALMHAGMNGQVECARALLDAGAMQTDKVDKRGRAICVLNCARKSLETLKLLCAYAGPAGIRLEALEARPIPSELQQWLAHTRRWTSPLHHFESLAPERVRALLVEGADVYAGDGAADAPTPLGLAAAQLLRGDGADDRAAALIVSAAAPWSPATHALFPAAARARALELLRVGWLLARQRQSLRAAASEMIEGALRDAWLGHVMPNLIRRASD